MIDGVIDHGIGKLYRHRGRRRGECTTDGGGGHADRAEIIGVVGRIVLALPAVGLSAGGDQHNVPLGAGSIWCVDVPKGERKVDGERDKRKP